MPHTSDALTAADASIVLDDAAGLPVDISGAANRVTFTFDQYAGAYRVIGDPTVYRVPGGRDAALTLDLTYTRPTDAAVGLLRAWLLADSGPRTLRVTVSGGFYSGEVLLTRLTFPLDAVQPAPVTVRAELMAHGPIAFTAS